MRARALLALAIGGIGALGCGRDRDGDGVPAAADCDDRDETIGEGITWYRDADGDGYGDPERSRQACSQQDGWVPRAGDCADTDPQTHPGASERWYDGWDQDCDGSDDYDRDGDGHAASDHGGDDCDDDDEEVHPGALEVPWDGVDSDCSGGSDDDYDGDGHDWDQVGGDDCDDLDPEVHPDAEEIWYDGQDRDCSGGSDYDQDGDGFDGDQVGGGDCDDQDPQVHPAAEELWYDGVDQDCDGASDYDQDGDGFESQDHGGEDCEDADPSIHPGAFDWNDGQDGDCDGAADRRYLDRGEWVLLAEEIGDGVGAVACPAGDIDGDGLMDLWLGAPGWRDQRGAAYLLRGSETLGSRGELDLWYADARVVGGSEGDGLGSALLGVGDLDGDGVGEVVVGAGGLGAAYLLAGVVSGELEADEALLVLSASDPSLELGAALAGGVDLDRDGGVDLALGAPGAEGGRGAVLLWHASSSGSVGVEEAFAVLEGATEGDRAGASAAVAGDLDGDGFEELLVGVPGHGGRGEGTGAAFLFLGPISGSVRVEDAAVSMLGEASGDAAGSAVAPAGDSDGDGYDDLLVGAPSSDRSAARGGAAYLLLGPLSGGGLELADADAVFSGDREGLEVGSDVAGGDVDGDGLDDVLVGAPGSDLAATDNGVGYLLLGPFSGSFCTCGSDAKIYGRDSDDRAGQAVALPGDMDGDGYGELLLGAPGADTAAVLLGAER
jgi:hypothetical protein